VLLKKTVSRRRVTTSRINRMAKRTGARPDLARFLAVLIDSVPPLIAIEPVKGRLRKMQEDLQSSISYAGGRCAGEQLFM